MKQQWEKFRLDLCPNANTGSAMKTIIFHKTKPIFIFTDLNIKTNLKVCQYKLKVKPGIYGVYGVINLLANNLNINQSKNLYQRFNNHIQGQSNINLQNAIEKDFLPNFAFVGFEFAPLDKLVELENNYLKSFNPDFLYNINYKGKKASAKTKEHNINETKLSLGHYKNYLNIIIK